MRITMTYASISDRTLTNKYFRMIEAVEANYSSQLSYFRTADHHKLIDMARGNSPMAQVCPNTACLLTLPGGGHTPRAVIIAARLAGSAVALETAGRGIGGAGYLPRW
jgi:hypothetical protein